jgi:glucan phosphoethanolaminetransferase (alkaline phosphatase superfamily)
MSNKSSSENIQRFSWPKIQFFQEQTPLKQFIFALSATILLFIGEMFFFQIDYVDFFLRTTRKGYEIWPSSYIAMLVFAMICSFLLNLALFWLILGLSKRMRIISFIALSLLFLYQYGYRHAVGRFATAEDMTMVLLYRSDATLLLDSTLVYIDWRAIIPIILFGLLLWLWPIRKPTRPTGLLLVLCMAFLFYSLMFRVWYITQSEYPTSSVSSFLRSASFTPWKWLNSYGQERDLLTYSSNSKPNNNIIFVVDESIASQHLSLNGYPRQTTPYLEQLQQQGLLYNWGEASSNTTISLSSNNLLLTGVHKLPAPDGQIARQATIFQYAKALGYTTYYLDASNPGFWNGTPNDLNYIDHWENVQRFADGPLYDADLKVSAYIRNVLSTSSGNFIWINKRGVHVLYNNTFPEDQAEWTPIMESIEYSAANREPLVNSYDNGVLYNVNGFFRDLLQDPAILQTTQIVYTADHGQTLAEHGENWSHGRDTRNEASVPLFVLSSTPLQVDLEYKASHANLFATLLDLMGMPKEARPYDYALSLFEARAEDSQPRYYFVGSVDGSSEWEIFPFDQEAP